MPLRANRLMFSTAALVFAAWPLMAQTPPQPASAPPVPLAAPAKTAPAKREDCTRLPLSDIAFGREATIVQARMRLGEYADKEAKRRGWGSYVKSAEVASCEVYIDFGPLVGTEYKCLLTATFCRK
jgi:hypothetical protein